ncbi:hypothetical protein GH714_026075 [Hevea brasiliensis]|uniref:Small EDRK-rich factor-like N-terminal domain-containing protein n=1 Tax=Hevea brasiliensis TaxID=3981 RepID=A0A6A6K6V8_HEVBR|nr:hypothetical protein GH714_026075 [Hevea brasiliensis]
MCERGNQRERDRERAQARAGHKPKNSKDDGLTPEQRRDRDAKALQEKAARKAAQAAVGGNNAGGGVKTIRSDGKIVREVLVSHMGMFVLDQI